MRGAWLVVLASYNAAHVYVRVSARVGMRYTCRQRTQRTTCRVGAIRHACNAQGDGGLVYVGGSRGRGTVKVTNSRLHDISATRVRLRRMRSGGVWFREVPGDMGLPGAT